MKKINLFFFLILISCRIFTCQNAYSQNQAPVVKWGEVSMEDLKMTSFPADTNATAVILFDRGEASMNENWGIVFKQHKRIKILTAAGFNWGTLQINYYTKGNMELIDDIEGNTFILSEDGKVVKYELKRKDIFKQKLNDNYEQIKFTLPSLSPGCIIEFRYTKSSKSPALPDWYFQTSEPTLWSEYEIRIPSYFQYAFVNQTYHQFVININEQVNEGFRAGGGVEMIQMNHSRWAMRNVPALRSEPYVTTLEDYTSKIMLQLAGVYWPGENPRKFLESWEVVGKRLMEDEDFGRQLKGYKSIRKQVEQLIDGITDTLMRIEAIYDFVRTTMVWNKYYGIVVDKDLDEVLEAKSGSCADINLLLTLMLKEAGFPAKPVILSTRNNGKIKTIYPMVDQFNYVISCVDMGGLRLFLDATDRLRPMNLLPYRALNHSGFLVSDSSYFVSIEPKGKAIQKNLATFELKPDGSLAGSFQLQYSEYFGTSERQDFEGEKPEDFVKSLIKSETSGFNIDSFTIANKDSIKLPFMVTANVSSSMYTQVLDSFIYMNPMTIDRMLESPFKSETRYFPVDFAYPLSLTYIINITIPDDYILKEYPKDFKINLASNNGTFSRISQSTGNSYQMMVKHEINRATFESNEYNTLRNFYNQILSRETEQLVFQKKNTPTSNKAGK
jgi:hypothetical protein